jgi:hypothetical protein
VIEWYRGAGTSASCFVILDGHRGEGVAEYAREVLPDRIRAGLQASLSDFTRVDIDWVAAVMEREIERCDAEWSKAQLQLVPTKRVRRDRERDWAPLVGFMRRKNYRHGWIECDGIDSLNLLILDRTAGIAYKRTHTLRTHILRNSAEGIRIPSAIKAASHVQLYAWRLS